MGWNPCNTRVPAGFNFALPGCDFQHPVPGFKYPDPPGLPEYFRKLGNIFIF